MIYTFIYLYIYIYIYRKKENIRFEKDNSTRKNSQTELFCEIYTGFKTISFTSSSSCIKTKVFQIFKAKRFLAEQIVKTL